MVAEQIQPGARGAASDDAELFAEQYLDWIGDRVTNIAEEVVFPRRRIEDPEP